MFFITKELKVMRRARISVDVDKDTQIAFKNLCTTNETSMTNVLEEAVKRILSGQIEFPQPPETKKPVE